MIIQKYKLYPNCILTKSDVKVSNKYLSLKWVIYSFEGKMGDIFMINL